jgi:hydroxymethylbilane synthase
MKNSKPLIIGTRGSRLAVWQAQRVGDQLGKPYRLEIVTTSGDMFRDIPLQGGTETGFFTKELEHCLASGKIDMAVHSLKDLPTKIVEGLTIGAYMKRAAVSDLLLIHPDWVDSNGPTPLKPGCPVGAGSLRRQALLRCFIPHAEPLLIRGNVPTRIEKCLTGQFGAIISARAGIDRLQADVSALTVVELNPEIWLPAPGQGAIAIEIRDSDHAMMDVLSCISHSPTASAVTIERTLLENFEGGCHTAFGAYALKKGNKWQVRAGIELPGKGWVAGSFLGDASDCMLIGPAHKNQLTVPEPICGESLFWHQKQ